MPEQPEEFITRLKYAMERAQQEQDSLSLSIPAPIRDQFFNTVVERLLEGDATHNANHCQTCLPTAVNMALNALGWEDRMAPRPALAKDRMEALLEQVTIALEFLDRLHKEGVTRRGTEGHD